MTHEENNLILILDDDIAMCSNIASYLQRQGYTTCQAHDGLDGLDLLFEKHPALAIVDLHMPHLDGHGFLRELRAKGNSTPIIITTGEPDMDSVIDVLQHGAQDFIVKPFNLNDIFFKVEQILDTIRHHRKAELLSELLELHSISSKLAATSDHNEVLDVVFHSCLQAVNSHHGYLMLFDDEQQKLSLVRAVGEYHGAECSSMEHQDEWPEAKWVCIHNRTVYIHNGLCEIPELSEISQRIDGAMIVTPLRAADQVVGVICVEGLAGDQLNGQLGRSLLEILAAQAGTAIKHAGLYHTLNQRISDLNFISDYAEQFVGMVDPEDVLISFLDTIRAYFSVDFLGVLLLKKRFHSFLYWSHCENCSDQIQSVLHESVTCFNDNSSHQITESRVKPLPLLPDFQATRICPSAFEHSHSIPLIWGDFEFGALVLKWERKPDQLENQRKLLRGIINQTRFALTNAKLYSDIKENYLRTIKALAIAVDAKDAYTHGHSENVMRYSEIVARYLKLPENEIERIKNGGLLHDIGKIGIPGYILNKPEPLTDEEFNGVMKTHPTLGANIIKDVPFLQELNPIILYHHENFDGTGYPLGLKGESIPFDARIVHVVDAYEAMTSNRPYRKSLGSAEAVKRLRACSGGQFDPSIVSIFIESMVDANEISLEDSISM